MDVVNQLFDSWEPGAVKLDRKTGTYADYGKVKPINFNGKYFKCRGPLNTCPSPQGRPTYVQAGGSERGRDFAANHTDSIIAGAHGNKPKKEFRDDIRRRAARCNRNPDDIKVLFLFAPVMSETEVEAKAKAKAKYDRCVAQQRFDDRRLTLFGGITDIDFSKFPMDKPLPEDLMTNGESTSLKRFAQFGSGKTLAQCIKEGAADVVGAPDPCASRMDEVMEGVGGDCFLLRLSFHHINHRYILEVTEGLVSALQRRGPVCTEYTQPTLREILRKF